MKSRKSTQEYSLCFLRRRALVTVVAVLAVLLLLRWCGVIVSEEDMPLQAVESAAELMGVPGA